MGACLSSEPPPQPKAGKSPEKKKTTPEKASPQEKHVKGVSPDGAKTAPQQISEAAVAGPATSTPPKQRVGKTPRTPRTPRGHGAGSEKGSVRAHAISMWGGSDMAESTDLEEPSPSPAHVRQSTDSQGTPARSCRALFDVVHESWGPGSLVHLELIVAADERVVVRILTADGPDISLSSIKLLPAFEDVDDPILSSLLHKLTPPASPVGGASSHSLEGHPRPCADTDGVERPSTPPLDHQRESSENAPSSPPPPGPSSSQAGMQTPDHRSMLRPVPPRSPGSFGGYLPPPPNALVLYTTSLRIVRKAWQESNLARGLLDTFCYVYIERDVSMSRQFQDELKRRLPEGVPATVPCLYFGDVFVGDYPHMCRLAESGDFDYALDCLGCRRRDVAPVGCSICFGVRFVVCPTCSGAARVPGGEDEEYGEMVECQDCNENGMVQCDCTLGSPVLESSPKLLALDRLTESPMSSVC